MAKQAIDAIRAAEAEAQRIMDGIPLRTKALLDEAERRSRALCAKAEEEATAETEAQLGQLRQRAAMLLERSAGEAEAEADRVREEARRHMSEAVKLIVWGIMAKCQ